MAKAQPKEPAAEAAPAPAKPKKAAKMAVWRILQPGQCEGLSGKLYDTKVSQLFEGGKLVGQRVEAPEDEFKHLDETHAVLEK